jgi:hypothetical protein
MIQNSETNKNLNTQRASGVVNIGSNGSKLAVASTNISINSNGMKIGFVQTFSPSEQRTITPIHELGTEGVIQMAAGNTTGGTLTLQRIALYNNNLWNALGLTGSGKSVPSPINDSTSSNDTAKYAIYNNPFKTLKDQRVPLEIKVETRLPSSEDILTETYIDCWLTSYSKAITSQSITISENCNMTYSDIV